jgi:intein/homing endonuclease
VRERDTWDRTVDFWRAQPLNRIVSRKEFIKKVALGGKSFDSCRSILTHGGYLETVESGAYKKIKDIPEGLTPRDCAKEALDAGDNSIRYYISSGKEELSKKTERFISTYKKMKISSRVGAGFGKVSLADLAKRFGISYPLAKKLAKTA